MAELANYLVLQNQRTAERVALSNNGDLHDLTIKSARPRAVPQGAVHQTIDEDYNLELEDADTIAAMQAALTSAGTFPLGAVLGALGIADRIVHPEAREGGVFRFTRAGKRHWGRNWINARVEYGVFVPAELEPYLTRKR